MSVFNVNAKDTKTSLMLFLAMMVQYGKYPGLIQCLVVFWLRVPMIERFITSHIILDCVKLVSYLKIYAMLC